MKKLFYLSFVVVFLAGCAGKQKEIDRLQAQNDSLQNVTEEREKTVNEFISAFNDIEANLETIKEKEKIISNRTEESGELTDDMKEKINNDIVSIYDLMQKNKKTIAFLNKKLKNTNIRVDEFTRRIEKLTTEINERDEYIANLKTNLERLNMNIDSLNSTVENLSENVEELESENQNKNETINMQDEKMHTAYWVKGTKRELTDNQVITKEGGFIGLGGIKKLKDNFNKDYFKTVDIRKLNEIALNTKNAELITTHPASSYQLIGDKTIEKLVIKDWEQFWSVSNYLVIMVD